MLVVVSFRFVTAVSIRLPTAPTVFPPLNSSVNAVMFITPGASGVAPSLPSVSAPLASKVTVWPAAVMAFSADAPITPRLIPPLVVLLAAMLVADTLMLSDTPMPFMAFKVTAPPVMLAASPANTSEIAPVAVSVAPGPV